MTSLPRESSRTIQRLRPEVVDLFAGGGGIDIGARALGVDPLGIEIDDAACATRTAAGLRTLQADVAALDPAAFAGCVGLIASAPCPTFSPAGKGGGRLLTDVIVRCLHELAAGSDTRAERCEEAYAVLRPIYRRRARAAAKRRKSTTDRLRGPGAPCWWCDDPIPDDKKPNAETCGARCRKARWRARRREGTRPIRRQEGRVPRPRGPGAPCWQCENPIPADKKPNAEVCSTVCRKRRSRRRATAAAVEKADARARQDAELSLLVVEPLRWALKLQPEWIALEQVPAVLGLWSVVAEILDALGYGTWTGVLSAECYGVPQTRKRAILLARRGAHVEPPAATHARYIPPRGRQREEGVRIVHPDDTDLEPWVSMADALGWGMTDRPYPVIAASRATGGPDKEKVGGSAARGVIYDGRDAGRWLVDTGNTRGGTRSEGRARASDEPAPVVTSRADQLEWRTHYDPRQQRDSRTGVAKFARRRSVNEPAPTIAGQSLHDAWVHERPATTVAGDPRVPQPGHKKNAASPDSPGRTEGSVRVTIEEALVLQSFMPDYPVQGTKTKQFQQVGNAVPPLFARHLLGALVPAVDREQEAA